MAGRRLRVHSDAEQDLVQGRDWYARRSFIAAERFLIEVELALDLVCETPERWPLFRLGMRRYVMPAFPYSVVYRVMPDTIDDNDAAGRPLLEVHQCRRSLSGPGCTWARSATGSD